MSRPRAAPATTPPPTPPTPGGDAAEHPADRAVRLKSRAGLTIEERGQLDAVLAAFAHYEAGDDAAARESLGAIGLRSPFLEWRVLLRGLMGYSAGDSPRALENWARLDPTRLPAKLALPFRAGLDDALGGSLVQPERDSLLARFRQWQADPLRDSLLGVRQLLGQSNGVSAALKRLAPLVPQLKERAPEALPALARALLLAIRRQGSSGDLAGYKKLFGAPADDPKFDRLHALAHEEYGPPSAAARHWLAYEAFLAAGPPGWPADLLTRARATVLTRAGDQLEADYLARDGGIGAYRRALELDPAYAPAVQRLVVVAAHGGADPGGAADELAPVVEAHHARDATTMAALGGLYAQGDRTERAAHWFRRAHAASPLDPRLRFFAAEADLRAAVAHLGRKEFAEAGVALDACRKLRAEALATPLAAFAEALAVATAGRKTPAPAEVPPAPDDLAFAFLSLAGLTMAQVTAAKRKPAQLRLDALVAASPGVERVTRLHELWVRARDAGGYRGFAAHDKLADNLALTAVGPKPPPEAPDAPGADAVWRPLFALVLDQGRGAFALKLLRACQARYGKTPLLGYIEAQVVLLTRPKAPARTILNLLSAAAGRPSGVPAYEGLMEAARELARAVLDRPKFAAPGAPRTRRRGPAR